MCILTPLLDIHTILHILKKLSETAEANIKIKITEEDLTTPVSTYDHVTL